MRFSYGDRPRSENSRKRPIWLYDPVKRKSYPGRRYKYNKNAHDGALITIRWAKVGVSIEVLNVNDAKLLGTYTRQVHQIKIVNGNGESK